MCGKQTRVDVGEYDTDDGNDFWDVPRRLLVNSYLRNWNLHVWLCQLQLHLLLLLLLHSGCTGYSSYLNKWHTFVTNKVVVVSRNMVFFKRQTPSLSMHLQC